MTFTSLARAKEIGANSYLLETPDCRIVLDAGVHPKEEGLDSLPHFQTIPSDSVDAIMLTHSHLDHAGALPVLMREQPSASVYMTRPAGALTSALLHNSINVMESKRTELGITEYPLYGHRELDRLEKRWQFQSYEKTFTLTENTSATFYDAGHILGSMGVKIQSPDHTLFYTGDIQFEDQRLIQGARFPTEGIDTLVIETTRGATPRKPDYTREQEEAAFCEALMAPIERGGSALVPVFAMGKTQEVLKMIHDFKKDGRIPEQTPVYIGGLSTKMTGIFDEYADYENRIDPGFEICEEMKILSSSKKRKRAPITYRPGAIFALSSGMMTEKTVSNVFAQSFLQNPKNGLVFVGYADPASPAGHIRSSNQGDVIQLDPLKEPLVLNSSVDIFDFSGHATRDAILEYILDVKPKRAILVHGDETASEWFREQLHTACPSMEVITPTPRQPYSL